MVKSANLIQSDTNSAVQIGAEFLSQKTEVIQKVLIEPADRVMFNHLMHNLEDMDKTQNYIFSNMNLLKGKIDLNKFVDIRFAKDAGAT